MTYIRWFLFLLFWTVVAGSLHYTLPQHDVVRVIDTVVRRTDVSQFSMFWQLRQPVCAWIDPGNAAIQRQQ